jgi:CBS domain-containing protein
MTNDDHLPGKSRASTLPELMSSNVITLQPEDTLRDAIGVLTGSGISGAPVVVNESVVGVISATDILEYEASTGGVPTERPDQQEWGEWGPAPEWKEGEEPAARYFTEYWADAGAEVDERFRAIMGPEWDVLQEHTVAEAMSPRICALPPDTGVAEAAGYMLRADIHRILVMDGDRLVGLVSSADVLRFVAGEQPGSEQAQALENTPGDSTGNA